MVQSLALRARSGTDFGEIQAIARATIDLITGAAG